jgi:hypothetical protein
MQSAQCVAVKSLEVPVKGEAVNRKVMGIVKAGVLPYDTTKCRASVDCGVKTR